MARVRAGERLARPQELGLETGPAGFNVRREERKKETKRSLSSLLSITEKKTRKKKKREKEVEYFGSSDQNWTVRDEWVRESK